MKHREVAMKPENRCGKRNPVKNISVLFVLISLVLFLYWNKDRIQGNYEKSLIKDETGGWFPTPDAGTFKIKELHFRPLDVRQKRYRYLQLNPALIAQAEADYTKKTLTSSQNVAQDVSDAQLWSQSVKSNPWSHEFKIKKETVKMKRLACRDPDYVESYLDYAHENPDMAKKVHLDWKDDDVVAPNMTDKDTVISLALMSSNAYVEIPYEGDWRNLTGWDSDVEDPTLVDGSMGWDADGVRGHVFANEDASVIVIAFKGTSAQGLPGSGVDETTENDKLNDNLLFSCCCARISYLWKTACDCYIKSYTCDEQCLEKELVRKDRYYQAVLDIYRSVLELHPNAAIWLTGHSLGGALASLVGRTFGAPAVGFEAPGELLATRRLHLPMPPGLPAYMEGIWHIGHTADPIFMGTCNGASSSCSIAGYAMETSCHSGKVCVYDVVTDKGWRVNMLNHRIHTVIDGVLNDYDEVAKCKVPEPCNDCFNWQYIRGRDTSKTRQTTATSRKKTATRLPTTVTPTATTRPPDKTTSTCVGRNWIGICTEYGA